MVAYLLGLKFRLIVNSLRRDVPQAIGWSIGVLFATNAMIAVVIGLVLVRIFSGAESTGVVTILVGAVVGIANLVLPLLIGGDDSLAPDRFRLLGIPMARLTWSLLAVAAVGVSGLTSFALAGAALATTTGTMLAWIFGTIALMVTVCTNVLAARVAVAGGGLLFSGRSARESVILFSTICVILIGPLISVLAGLLSGAQLSIASFAQAAGYASWSPWGAGWAVAPSFASGRVVEGLAHLLIVVAYALALVWGWRVLVAKLLVAPSHSARTKRYSGLGWFARFPATPRGVIAARAVTYWLRDPRYRLAAVSIVLVPFIIAFAAGRGGHFSGRPLEYLGVVLALFLGFTMQNDLSYDSTAWWSHVVAHVRARDDLVGRFIPVLIAGAVAIPAVSILGVSGSGRWSDLPAVLGLSLGVFLAGLGLAAISMVGLPYAVVAPGGNPLKKPRGVSTGAALLQSLGLFAALLLLSPAIALHVVGVIGAMPWMQWLAGVAAIVIGLVVLALGLKFGARIYDARRVTLLQLLVRYSAAE